MGWLKAILTVLGVINRATDGKRIVVGKDDKVILDIDKLPAGDPGHNVDPRPNRGAGRPLGLLVLLLAATLSSGCGYWIKVIAPAPAPTPVVTPVPDPTPTPVPDPPPTPVPDCLVTGCPDGQSCLGPDGSRPFLQEPGRNSCQATPVPEPPAPAAFPVRFPLPGAILYMRNHQYGNGLDATPRINGDRELCEALHHVPVPNGDCHFDSDVWQYEEQRADYEGLVLAGARHGAALPAAPLGPVWEYKAGGQQRQCRQREDDYDNTSCDHFGSAASGWRDDPKTAEFEGRPLWLSAQRDEYGPYAGWFMVPQTSGKDFGTLIRACLPGRIGDEATCAPWVQVNWK